uniref:potassium channel family protein n=2 Tax=Algoriphagus sp. TaxID=1872435 RepID=UPI004048C8BF
MATKERVRVQVKKVAGHINEYLVNDLSFVVLLLVLLFIVFILPILIEYGHLDMFIVNLVFIFLFFTGIWSCNNRSLVVVTASLFLAQVTLKFLRIGEIQQDIYLLERIAGILNMGVFIFLNVRLLFRNQEVNLYRVIGAINVYLLVAITGAFGFEIIHLTIGSSIENLNQTLTSKAITGVEEDFAGHLYFSLVSLTTVGFGDYTPVNMLSKMLAVFLSTIGILYPAVVIARLVGAGPRN